MTWLCVPCLSSPASAGSTSPCDEWACAPCVTSNGKLTPRPSSWPGWRMRPWIRLLSGMTLAPSTASHGVAEWIASLADSPVRTSPSQGEAVGSTASGRVYGASMPASSKPFALRLYSSRMCPHWLSAGSIEFCTICMSSGSMRSGICSLPPTSAPRTAGNDSSFWPTPIAASAGYNQGGSAGRVGPKRYSLHAIEKLWPTPIAREGNRPREGGPSLGYLVTRMWPTPTADDAKQSGAAGYSTASGRHAGTTLTDATCRSPLHETMATGGEPTSTGGRVLNPRFVEALMGLPIGWTDCASSETPSYLRRPSMHSASSPSGAGE